MQRRHILTIVGAIAAVLIVGAVLFLSYFLSLIAPKPLTIQYATIQSSMPQGAACIGGDQGNPGIAKEFINLETDDIYVAAGPNAIPDDVWENLSLRLPLLKNSTRNLLFDGSCFYRSPDVPADCEGEACMTVESIVGYSWLKLTSIAGTSCYPDASGCSGTDVQPGFVSINTIAKCHRIVYEGPIIYELADEAGNRFVMHATADGIPNLSGPELPRDWTLTERIIEEPLVLMPFGGGDECYYNIIRDNLVQSYHQFAYAGELYPE